MKVILTQDIKGKGFKDEIKDFPNGYANFIIRNNQAVMATPQNLAALEAKKAEEARLEAQHLEEMKELKKVIEANVVKIYVNTNQDGKVLGSITTKIIAENLEECLNIKVDKRKITFDLLATALGTYQAKVQLHKQVTATITFVLEKKNK